jgi:hypothetical protein
VLLRNSLRINTEILGPVPYVGLPTYPIGTDLNRLSHPCGGFATLVSRTRISVKRHARLIHVSSEPVPSA